ncbi:MAG: TylF/MycF/NovP-related O-methyltransferase [Alphaproteobacteria bacterium]|nr:TylF/MycF/NovP-related O-methyltransferase [Alphaproteobacteria bacterium]
MTRRGVLIRKVRLAHRLLRHLLRVLKTSKETIASTRLVPEDQFKKTVRDAVEKTGLHRSSVGDYLEFGVYNGTSLYCMYEVLEDLGLTEARLFGFDSFQGLPLSALGDDNRVWLPGQYKCDLGLTKKILTDRGVDWRRVHLIKGWFKDTLNQDLIEKYKIEKASIVMVDCDIYSSSKEALGFCSSLIGDEALIIFDDWASADLDKKSLGEKKAFKEFLEDNPGLSATEVGSYNENSLIFHVTRTGDSPASGD